MGSVGQTGLALVTGATGFVGANVARALLDTGREVRCLARPGSDRRNLPEHPGLSVAEGDLRDPDAVERAVRDCGEVFHVAADYRYWARNPDELYTSNVVGTRNLLEAATRAGVSRFIHTSTVGTIGLAHQPQPCDEESPAHPGQFTSHYKRSKAQAEGLALDYVRHRGLPVIVVNPSTPIGPWDRKPTPTGKIIVDFVNGRLPAYVDTGLCFVDVRDVARGHVLAAERGKPGERYILGNRNLTMLEFLRILAGISGRRPPKIRIPYPVAWATGLVSTLYADHVSGSPPAVPIEAVRMSRRYMYFDASKAVRELGLPQTPVADAAQDAWEWFAKNGYFSQESCVNLKDTPAI